MRGHAKTVSCACIYASRGEGGRAIVHIYMHPAVRGLTGGGGGDHERACISKAIDC